MKTDYVVKAKSKKSEREASVTMTQWPENLTEAQTLWGETNCFNLLMAKADIKVQDTIRRLIEAGKSDEEIKTTVSAMKIDAKISAGPRDTVQATVADLKKLTKEERTAKIADLMKMLKELNQAA